MSKIMDQLSEIERHLLRVSFDRAEAEFEPDNSVAVVEAIDAYIRVIRQICLEDQGNANGKHGTVGRTVQDELRALKLKITSLAVERDYGDTVVAVAVQDDGLYTIIDHCFNWQTAQNFALHEGLTVIAVADDGSMSKEEIQAMCDSEKAAHDDCFGVMPEIEMVGTEHDEVSEGARERREFYRNRDY